MAFSLHTSHFFSFFSNGHLNFLLGPIFSNGAGSNKPPVAIGDRAGSSVCVIVGWDFMNGRVWPGLVCISVERRGHERR